MYHFTQKALQISLKTGHIAKNCHSNAKDDIMFVFAHFKMLVVTKVLTIVKFFREWFFQAQAHVFSCDIKNGKKSANTIWQRLSDDIYQ